MELVLAQVYPLLIPLGQIRLVSDTVLASSPFEQSAIGSAVDTSLDWKEGNTTAIKVSLILGKRHRVRLDRYWKEVRLNGC